MKPRAAMLLSSGLFRRRRVTDHGSRGGAIMTAENWRCTAVVVVPHVVGLHVREAARFAHDAGLKLAQPA
jgi:hypothetical protein